MNSLDGVSVSPASESPSEVCPLDGAGQNLHLSRAPDPSLAEDLGLHTGQLGSRGHEDHVFVRVGRMKVGQVPLGPSLPSFRVLKVVFYLVRSKRMWDKANG